MSESTNPHMLRYDELAKKYGFCHLSCGWNSEYSETTRFLRFIAHLPCNALSPIPANRSINEKYDLRVLDIGCGHGALLKMLKNNCHGATRKYTGLDISQTMLDLTRIRLMDMGMLDTSYFDCQLHLVAEDIMEPWFTEARETERFNVVFAGGISCNFASHETMADMIFKMHELLLPGGMGGVNFLTVPGKHKDGTPLTHFDPVNVYRAAKWVATNVVLDEGYFPHDATVIFRRKV